ncbi:MAG TPA: hypothetical protein VGJ15_12265 [Pirellulales bacterium]
MRQKFIWIVICAAATAALAGNDETSTAACRTKSVAKSADEALVIVPFAVPVGVPVAPFAPYFYSYQPVQPTAPVVAAQAATTQADRVQPESLVAARCANCHGGAAPKAGLSLEQLDSLSADDRLRAIRAVAAGRMPKGSRPSTDEVRSLINELAQPAVSPSKTSVAAPPTSSQSPSTSDAH